MKEKIILFSGFILFFIMIISGCGSDNVITSLPVITPTAVTGEDIILSTVTEIASNTGMISSTAGGEINYKGMEIDVSPGTLSSDNEIEIAEVTIIDNKGSIRAGNKNGNGAIYEISSGSPDEVINLNKPIKVDINIDPNSPNPGLALWSGEEWLPIDPNYVTYDRENHKLSTYIDFIGENSHEYEIDGQKGDLEGPQIVTYFPNINEGDGLNNKYPYHQTSKENRFTIHYDNNMSSELVIDLGNALEDYMDYYEALGYATPVNFSYTANHDQSNWKSDKIMVYIRTDAGKMAWASREGVILIPAFTKIPIQAVSSHELFHLVQFQYTKRKNFDTWIGENIADSIGPYAYNSIYAKPTPMEYDYPNTCKPANTFWDGAHLFTYSLNSQGNNEEYQNAVIWCYFISKYGLPVYKNIVESVFSLPNTNKITLKDLDGIFITATKESLHKAYFEAFEDYFVYGKVYNKEYFNNFPTREPNAPLFDPSGGYGNNDNYNAFDANSNPYYDTETIDLPYLSGSYLNFKSSDKTGSLHLEIVPSNKNEFTVKIYSFKERDLGFSIVKLEEYNSSNISELASKIIPYSDGVSNITILLENSSLSNNNSVSMRAYGK